MTHLYLKPNSCPLILETIQLIYHGTWPTILRSTCILKYFWQIILHCGTTLKQIICFLLLFASWISLIFGSSLAYFCISVLYWIRKFNIEILSRQRECDRTIFQIFKDPARKQPETLAQAHSRRRLFDADTDLHNAWASWRDSTELVTHWIRRTWDAALHWLGPFEQTQQVLFWIYSTCLLGLSVLYFLFRIISYKIGWIRYGHPQCKRKRGRLKRWSHHRKIRRWRHRRKWKHYRRKGKRRLKQHCPPHATSSPSRFSDSMPTVLATVLNVDERAQRTRENGMTAFDTDSATIVCDNSANVHICNERSMFVGELRPVPNTKVATIGGKGHAASGVGTVKWIWLDENGKAHEHLIENCLFFPQSPINILSVTSFAKQLEDEEGTGIDTKQRYSRFYWNFGKNHRIIRHPESNLPELSINEGFSQSRVYRVLVSKVINTDIHQEHSCCFTRLDDDDRSTCIKQAHSVCDNMTTELFDVGETVFFSKDGYSTFVKIKSFKLDDSNVLRFTVNASDGTEIVTTREHLRAPDNPDIGWIPKSVPEYKSAAHNLSDKEIEKIVSPIHLSPLQQEFLSLHCKLFHLPFTIMLRMASIGILPRRFLKLRNDLPPCMSCLFGQSHRKPWRHKGSATGGILRGKDISQPGERVSTDQIVSAQPGLVPQDKGQLTRSRIWGATIFVDHATKWIKVHLMQNATGDETLEAKESFEHASSTRGVHVQHYHADNGRFAEPTFVNDCKSKMQKISFCGVGAHHQNGVAENSIKQLTLSARTLLLHAQRHWPEYITTMMWPYALLAAADRINNLHIDLDGKTPEMKFSTTAGASTRLNNFHTFGCPAYILDARLQDGGGPGAPKWEPRSRLGIYVGHSPFHAGSVALVLNPKTGLISPQFHVVFDDNFSTVPHLRSGTVPKNWAQLVEHSSHKCVDGFFDVTKTWFEGTLDESAMEQSNVPAVPNSTQVENILPLTDVIQARATAGSHPVDNPHPSTDGFHAKVTASDSSVDCTLPNLDAHHARAGSSGVDSLIHNPSLASPLPSEGGLDSFPIADDSLPPSPVISFDSDSSMPPIIDFSTAGLRRSGRIKKQPNHFTFGSFFTMICAFGMATSSVSQWTSTIDTTHTIAQNFAFASVQRFHSANKCFDNTLNALHPMVLMAGKENNETFTFQQMLKEKDCPDFVQAMKKEVDDHEIRGHWQVVPRNHKPPGEKSILAIWAFKRKRFPDGRLNKHKARLCAHGGMQQWGINYWETYSPTVNWISVRFLLTVAEILQLETQAIDFVLAFPQADLDVPVYMELPAGMEIEGQPKSHLLLLKKNLYGLKQASFNWHKKLKTALEERNFVESLSDPCVFIRDNMIILTFVDDCILISKDKSVIQEFILSLSNGPENFDFTDEGTLSQYLGVDIARLPDGGFCLSQPFLIERIINLLQFDPKMTKGVRGNTPASYPLLSKDKDGLPRKCPWKYRTAIGMLGYLSGSTRPDISMATHQCARFNNDPKLSHERAVKKIGRYLLDTKDKGLIFKPDTSKGLECYVDADFAGAWKDGDHACAESVLSRTGFVIMYAGCPITWQSKLQTEIALSTTESEYIALSTAMREVIPFLNLLKEISDVFDLPSTKPVFNCKVWEDNESCIKVATSPKFTLRTKHIAIKYHHFRSFVQNETITIHSIGTKEQLADILTKPLVESSFRYLRQKLMGW